MAGFMTALRSHVRAAFGEDDSKHVENEEEEVVDLGRRQLFAHALEILRSRPHLWQAKDAQGHSLLHWAALAGTADFTQQAIAASAPVNARVAGSGQTPLMWATIGGHLSVMRALIDGSADPRARDNKGATPLIIAVQHSQVPPMELLLEICGVSVTTDGDSNSCTAVHWAAYCGLCQGIRLLSKFNADMEAVDGQGLLPMHRAIMANKGDAVRCLLATGRADLATRDAVGRDAADVAAAQQSSRMHVTVLAAALWRLIRPFDEEGREASFEVLPTTFRTPARVESADVFGGLRVPLATASLLTSSSTEALVGETLDLSLEGSWPPPSPAHTWEILLHGISQRLPSPPDPSTSGDASAPLRAPVATVVIVTDQQFRCVDLHYSPVDAALQIPSSPPMPESQPSLENGDAPSVARPRDNFPLRMRCVVLPHDDAEAGDSLSLPQAANAAIADVPGDPSNAERNNESATCRIMKGNPSRFQGYVLSRAPSTLRWRIWKEALGTPRAVEERLAAAGAGYDELCRRSSQWSDLIEADASRTCRDLDEEQQQAVRRVLEAYAAYDPSVGYCQGMNMVAGFLLLVCGYREQESFDVLVRLMGGSIGLEALYTDGFPLLLRYKAGCERVLEEVAPSLVKFLVEQGMYEGMFVERWLLSLFVDVLPAATVATIWDALICGGSSEVLPAVAVALLQGLSDRILSGDLTDVCAALKTTRRFDLGDHDRQTKAWYAGHLLLRQAACGRRWPALDLPLDL